MSDHEHIDPATTALIDGLKKGPRSSATTAPDPGPASSGAASATSAPVSPPRATRPPSPPVPPRSSGGGHGGGHGGESTLSSLGKLFAKIAVLVLMLLVALSIIDWVLDIGRTKKAESTIRDLAIREKEIELEAKARAILQPAKPVDTTLKAQIFWCGSQEAFNKGFVEERVQKLDKTFIASEGCAHVVIDGVVAKIEGHNFAFDYPAPNNQFYSCAPNSQNPDCVRFLNYIRSSSDPDKRVRLIVKNGGLAKVYLN